MAAHESAHEAHTALAAYYTSPAVRERIIEYFDGRGTDPGSFSALEAAGYGGRQWLQELEGAPVRLPIGSWTTLMAQGADVCRSLADSGGTLLHLDVDYVSPGDPAEPYRQPHTCFERLEPVHQAIRRTFLRFGVRPLVLMSGRGYHYVVRAPESSALREGLVQIGARAERLQIHYDRLTTLGRIALNMERAHEAAGRLLEFLAHEALRDVRSPLAVPVLLADVPPPGKGPFICLDLTAYADPLMTRDVRVAFSSNQKALVTGAAPDVPFVLNLPRGEESYSELLPVRRDPGAAARLARVSSARIPDVHDATAWLAEYRSSALAYFHTEFDSAPMRGEGLRWGEMDLELLPACARMPLRFPNPLLLQPTHLRTLSLGLWSLGWHPRAIADLIRSRFEETSGWGGYWSRYDAAGRADFYVRVLCGAAVMGLEDGLFTCRTQTERGLCTFENCGHDIGAAFIRLRRQRAREEAHA